LKTELTEFGQHRNVISSSNASYSRVSFTLTTADVNICVINRHTHTMYAAAAAAAAADDDDDDDDDDGDDAGLSLMLYWPSTRNSENILVHTGLNSGVYFL